MKQFKILLLSSMVMLFTACGGGSSPSETTAVTSESESTSTTAVTSDSTPSVNDGTGLMSLSITDAKPRLPKEPIAVNITVTGIEFNYNGKWTDVNDFEFENDQFENDRFEPQVFNLLELQDGRSLHLGNFILPAGHYKEIRFKLDAPEKGEKVKSNPGCNIVFAEEENDGTLTVRSEPLFVPSGGQSGYKGKGDFYITANAKIEIMADFNVEKSIVVTGNEKYLLKPVIRLVVTELSGTINGTVVDIERYYAEEEENDLSVYAYERDLDIRIVDELIGNSEGILFPNAVTSADVNMTDGNFTLSFLGEGSYNLVTVNTNVDGVAIVDMEENVEILKGQVKPVDVNTSDFIRIY